MKALIIGLIIGVNVISLVITAASLHYDKAMQAVSYSDGSDLAIEEIMHKYGFNEGWDHDYTTFEKIEALLK